MKKIDVILKITWIIVGVLVIISLIPSIYSDFQRRAEQDNTEVWNPDISIEKKLLIKTARSLSLYMENEFKSYEGIKSAKVLMPLPSHETPLTLSIIITPSNSYSPKTINRIHNFISAKLSLFDFNFDKRNVVILDNEMNEIS